MNFFTLDNCFRITMLLLLLLLLSSRLVRCVSYKEHLLISHPDDFEPLTTIYPVPSVTKFSVKNYCHPTGGSVITQYLYQSKVKIDDLLNIHPSDQTHLQLLQVRIINVSPLHFVSKIQLQGFVKSTDVLSVMTNSTVTLAEQNSILSQQSLIVAKIDADQIVNMFNPHLMIDVRLQNLHLVHDRPLCVIEISATFHEPFRATSSMIELLGLKNTAKVSLLMCLVQNHINVSNNTTPQSDDATTDIPLQAELNRINNENGFDSTIHQIPPHGNCKLQLMCRWITGQHPPQCHCCFFSCDDNGFFYIVDDQCSYTSFSREYCGK